MTRVPRFAVVAVAVAAGVAGLAIAGCASPPDPAPATRAAIAAQRGRVAAPPQVTETDTPFVKARPVDYVAPGHDAVHVKVDGAPLGAVLAGLARGRGYAVSFAGAARADHRVTLDTGSQPFARAIRDVALAAGYAAVIDARRRQIVVAEEATYFFRVPAHLTERTTAQFAVQANPGLPTPTASGGSSSGGAGAPGLPAASGAGASGANTAVAGQNLRSAEALVAALTGLAGGTAAAAAGRVSYVPESALVGIRGNGLTLRRAHDLMDAVVRDSQQQVEVHAALVEVQLGRTLQYGIDWERVIPNGRWLGDGGRIEVAIGGQAVAQPSFRATVTGQSVQAVITALQGLTEVRVVAQPSAITRNHMDAVLYRGRQVPYLAEVSTTATANVGTTASARLAYVPEGTSIALRASVVDAQRVDLRIAPQQIQGIEFRGFAYGNGNQLQAPTFPLAQALLQLVVEQGRTYVIGGLNLESDRRDDREVPGLAQVPLLGALFTATDRGTVRSQLVLLLTARILPAPAEVDSLMGATL